MSDVARLARVSRQTVSRVLNGQPYVQEQTRLRILAAIEELGYRPNGVARALVTGRSRLIGVVASDSTLHGPVSMLAAFEQAAHEAGFTTTVHRVDVRNHAHVSRAFEDHQDQQVVAIAVLAPTAAVDDAVDTVPSDVPVVAIGGDPRRRPIPRVVVDQAAGGFEATRHLLEAGHRTVWHLSCPPDSFDGLARARGWRDALVSAGAEVPPVVTAGWSAASGYRAGRELARKPEVTAVFAANDFVALGVLRAMAEQGRRVPQDVSVVGFDDVPEAAYFTPPLTTIRLDFGALAREALDLLLAQVGGEELGAVRRVCGSVLVRRDSVRPPST